MAPSFAELLHSKQSTFLIGEGEDPVTVHSGIIAALSPSLEQLINGPMREAHDNITKFPELLMEDFERICEFAYRGDYSVPHPENFESSEFVKDSFLCASPLEKNAGRTDLIEDLDEKDIDSLATKYSLQEHFVNRQYFMISWSRRHAAKLAYARRNNSCRENFGPVFLAHARLYAFASRYMVPELKSLALFKLHKTLARYTLYFSGRSSILELVRYAYDNDHIRDRDMGNVDPLRQLTVEFVAMNLRYFKDMLLHREFLGERNEYSADLLDVIQAWLL